MATIEVSFTVGEGDESFEVTAPASEVWTKRVDAVWKEEPTVVDGVAVLKEDGTAQTTPVLVTPARQETLEEAATRYLRDSLTVLSADRSGLESLRFTVTYTVSGEVELEYDEGDLSDAGLDEYSVDDLDDSVIRDSFDDAIRDAIKEDISYGYPETDFDINDFEAE